MTDADLNALRRIGWRGAAPAERVARVVVRHRAGYRVHDGNTDLAAQPAAHFLKHGLDPALRPAVGDFVLVDGDSPLQIERVLPRRSSLTRAAAGERYERQIIATNIDYVLVVTGLDGDFNPRRIERYLSLIEGSGAQAVVVLTKVDRAGSDPRVDDLRQRLPATTPVHAINAKDETSIAEFEPYLGLGDTAVLVGSSGAGKSTLTNTLLGELRMATAAVRSHDSRGRHTTTHRALLQLASGGCLIDTPGMRELKLTGDEDLDLFADIESLATQCRFADCAHTCEPGCAILKALADGGLDAGRWHNYVKLREEREQQALILEQRLQRKSATRSRGKALGRHQRERGE